VAARRLGSADSIAFIELFVNTAPSGGTCTVSPLNGTSSETQFTITCSDWTDTNGIKQYQFLRKLIFLNISL